MLKFAVEFFRERPPGLIQHVLTVLVFLFWVLLPRPPPSSQSLRLCPWASILLHGPLDIAWICCPQLPHHPYKTGRTAHVFYSTGGHTPSFGGKCFWRFSQQKQLENLLPNFAGSSPPISPKTSPTSLWKSLVLMYWTEMGQNGPNDQFGQNDLIPNRILASARPNFGLFWSIFGLFWSVLVRLGPPTALWPFLTKPLLKCSFPPP